MLEELDMELLAKRLKWLRERERYSQKEIAEKIGMSSPGYQKIEYGDREPKLDVLIKFCNIYNVSADFLLGINDSLFDITVLKSSIHDTKRNLDRNEERKLTIQQNLLTVQSELIKIAQKEGFESERVKKSHGFLTGLEDDLRRYENANDDILFSLKELITEYIETIINIPGAHIKNDRIIEIFALRIETIPNGDNTFGIMLVSDVIEGYVGLLASCDSEIEAQETSKYYQQVLFG